MELSKFSPWEIYNSKSRFKLLILVIALVIGAASIYYTQQLVNKLADRERKLIDLYAKALKFAGNSENAGDLSFIFEEIVKANESVPVILTDENRIPVNSKNVDLPAKVTPEQEQEILMKEIMQMRMENDSIEIEFAPGFKNYIFYKNSFLLRQLLYYPYVQLTIIAIFAIIAYMAFSYSRNSEQNRVWVGLAKETAHQLGTPLSSLMAWVELFRSSPKYKDDEVVVELEKDVDRLEMITARFSSIGSAPTLVSENIYDAIKHTVDYLKARASKKVIFNLHSDLPPGATAKINRALFDWVIENICKNAIDAMNGAGTISIHISSLNNARIAIDISDTGKGIARSKFNQVFEPGYTTKQRGWGLGLTLVKRIVHNYHKGKIYVLSSEIGKGTTFRIIVSAE
ncbi:MAG: HAMP domain-containing histidine kinase [Cytophagaceae bacterium]|nr:HAMP domain-containing histidine kinase [Cytophagaceae bacterium]